jgi:hypothetical protein
VEDRARKIARYASVQAAAELGLGSLVHALHVPFGGHVLSLNQALVLGLATQGALSRKEALALASGVSNASALIKSLSPAGAKLMPMLAIAAQGMLYCAGLAAFGSNWLGALAGTWLLSLWAFAQPLLFAYFVFGQSFFLGVSKLWLETALWLGIPTSWGPVILGGFVGAKLLAGTALVASARLSGKSFEIRYLAFVERLGKRLPGRVRTSPQRPSGAATSALSALRDLTHPWFLASMAISLGFVALSRGGEAGPLLLQALRIVALGWLGFWLAAMLRTPEGFHPR